MAGTAIDLPGFQEVQCFAGTVYFLGECHNMEMRKDKIVRMWTRLPFCIHSPLLTALLAQTLRLDQTAGEILRYRAQM